MMTTAVDFAPSGASRSSYRSRASAEQVALAYHSARNPELRERLQLTLMRHARSWGMAELGKIAASDRYYEQGTGGEWPEDH